MSTRELWRAATVWYRKRTRARGDVMSLYQELKRRNVIRVAVAYVVTAWLLMQVADLVLDNIGAPAWVMQSILLLLAIGFPLAIVFAWAFEITPEGLKLERDVSRTESITPATGRKLDFTIIGLLAVVAVYFIWEARFQDATNAAETNAAASASDTTAPATTDVADTNTPTSPSVAVLPFVNLSSDPEQEYFSEGISEELLNVLAQFPDLQVAARTSSFQFKGDNRNISEIAQLLKVNHVVEGSVRKAGNRLRITAQLIEAENGYHLWSETYDRELKDVFAIQDEISGAIGEALKAKLKLGAFTADVDTPRVAEASNTAAYEAYLHGRYLINQRGNKAITEAVHQLEKSVRLDPEYAPSRAQLAIAFTMLHNNPATYGDLSTEEVNTRAKPHLEKAFELTDSLAEAWGARCMLAQVNDENEKAIEYARRALELNPAYIDAMNWMNTSALVIGKYELAYEYIQRIQEVDPLSVIGRLNYAGNFLAFENPEEAHRIADDLLEASAWAGHVAHANISATEGKMTDAVRWGLLAFRDNPLDAYSNQLLALGFSAVQLQSEATRVSRSAAAYAALTKEQFSEARDAAASAVADDPDNRFLISNLAYIEYYAENFDRALKTSRELHERWPASLPVSGGYSPHPSLRYVWLLRRTGLAAEAEEILARVERNLDSKEGMPLAKSPSYFRDRALVAWLRGDPEHTLDIMESVPVYYLLPRNELLDPMLAPLRDNPRYQRLIARYDEWALGARRSVQQMVCLDNPIPDTWRPLADTCTGLATAAAY